MTRLIDAESLMYAVDGNPLTTDSLKEYVRSTVKAQPTVDAVPVIRCKDCKYYSGFDCHMWNHRGENTRLLVYEDDYCSNAVRKEE